MFDSFFTKIGIYGATLFCLFFSIFSIVPNLKYQLSDFDKTTKILKSTDYESYKYNSKKWKNRGSGAGFRSETRENTGYTLVLTMTDNSKYEIGNDKAKYFTKITKNEGKDFIIYTESNNKTPMQLEIDNKVIYDIHDTNLFSYFILAMTLGLTIYSGLKIKKYV